MASVSSGSDDVELNMMPMLDIFSILITFLLMSFSTDPVTYAANAGMELPESITIQALDEEPAIVVTKKELKINGKPVTVIENGDVPLKDQAQGAIFPVFKELEKLMEANKRAMRRVQTDLDKVKAGTITMEMDANHRFKLMKRIMLSAQQAEFVNFKLMVAKGDS